MVKICAIIIIIFQLLSSFLLTLAGQRCFLWKISHVLQLWSSSSFHVRFFSYFASFFDAFKYVRSCHGLLEFVCVSSSEYTAWCEIMTNENDNESNGKEPIFYKFLTAWMVFPSFLIWCKHQRLDILCRCRHAANIKETFSTHLGYAKSGQVNSGCKHYMVRSLHCDHTSEFTIASRF